MEVKHCAWRKVRWEFYEGQKDPWLEQYVEYSSMIQRFDVHVGFEWNHRSVGYGSVHWNDHVLRREDGHVWRRALDFEVEGQRKKNGGQRGHGRIGRKLWKSAWNWKTLCRLVGGESGHSHLLGIQPDSKHWSISLLSDTTQVLRLLQSVPMSNSLLTLAYIILSHND